MYSCLLLVIVHKQRYHTCYMFDRVSAARKLSIWLVREYVPLPGLASMVVHFIPVAHSPL